MVRSIPCQDLTADWRHRVSLKIVRDAVDAFIRQYGRSKGRTILTVISIWTKHLSRWLYGQSGWNPARVAMMWFFAVRIARSALFGFFTYGGTNPKVSLRSLTICKNGGLVWLSIRRASSVMLWPRKNSTVCFKAGAVCSALRERRGIMFMYSP
jgi:hypothetical protein